MYIVYLHLITRNVKILSVISCIHLVNRSRKNENLNIKRRSRNARFSEQAKHSFKIPISAPFLMKNFSLSVCFQWLFRLLDRCLILGCVLLRLGFQWWFCLLNLTPA